MSKRTNLAAALHDAGARPAQQPPALAVVEPAAPVSTATTTRPPSRAGLRAVTSYVNTEAHAQLAVLAIEQGQAKKRRVTTQEVMIEAMNDLFRKYGRSAIA